MTKCVNVQIILLNITVYAINVAKRSEFNSPNKSIYIELNCTVTTSYLSREFDPKKSWCPRLFQNLIAQIKVSLSN